MKPPSVRTMGSGIWKQMHHDGLFALFFCVALTANALSMLLDELGVAAAIRIGSTLALHAVGIVGSWLMRRRHIVPRTDTVKFGPGRRHRICRTRIVLAISALLTLALLALAAIARFSPAQRLGALGDYGPFALMGGIVLISLAAISYTFDSPRMPIHGMLFVGAEFATVALGRSLFTLVPGAIAFGSAAVITLTIGLLVFVRFLRIVPRAQQVPLAAAAHAR